MNILLLGHRGYLGSYLHIHLPVDVLDPAIRKVYHNNKKYDYVINCIGKSILEYCETHIEETEYSNHLIINDIQKIYPEAKIINFSSYYVYDDAGLCTETSRTTDAYHYCRQKLSAELAVTNGVTFRLGKLFGNPQGNQYKLTEYILQNNDLTLDLTEFNPTSVRQILEIVQYELRHHTLSGIYNLANLGIVSQYEYGKWINKYLGTKKTIRKIKKTNRIFHNYGKFTMSVDKLNSLIPLRHWEQDMEEYLKQRLG